MDGSYNHPIPRGTGWAGSQFRKEIKIDHKSTSPTEKQKPLSASRVQEAETEPSCDDGQS